ncbi:unnamed protein product [Symbiodinium sp. CCMP2592]|nr:unnamed protein product [Symbiodinium sp. CCMP2592]
MHAIGFWLPLLACLPLAPCLPKANTGLTRLEIEELAFMKSSLRREMDGATDPGHVDSGPQAQEKAIRRAYRNIARRFRKNIFEDQAKFEFQMRILNLAKEAMVKGEGLGGEGWGDEDDDDDEDDNETKGPGRELPGNSRASDDILKQIHGWQEFALEEGVRFDDPDEAFFVGHTQHAFRDAFAANWSHFLRQELAGLWPATSALRYQVELDGSSSPAARADALLRAPEPETALDTGTRCPGLEEKALANNGRRAESCCAFCMRRDIVLLAYVLWDRRYQTIIVGDAA